MSARSGPPPPSVVAVFAHNESGRIRQALESIDAAAGGQPVAVFVLANGCTDATIAEVRAIGMPDLTLVEIELGDKANAWNVFVHDVVTPERAAAVDAYFFMDGDVRLEPGAIAVLGAALKEQPSAHAAGAMPATGRDRDRWRERMVRNGTLAGNLYALRRTFVDTLRQRGIRMPIGLIGEDLFLSWLVANMPTPAVAGSEGPPCIFCANAQFSFRSLSLFRLDDVRKYVRRKWRYTYRALQLEMLMSVLRKDGIAALPPHVDELYATAPLPSRLKWIGLDSPMRLLAVLQIRAHRR